MAVTMTTKFYEEYTTAWHDLSKIVFTSPNIDSPNTAGIRSHILPGQGDLALWYEDTSNMYEIEPLQDTYDTSFYYYNIVAASGINLDENPTSAIMDIENYPSFIDKLYSNLGINIVGYLDKTSDILSEELTTVYTLQIVNDYTLNKIYSSSIIAVEQDSEGRITKKKAECWKCSVIVTIPECYIDFDFGIPTNIRRITMAAAIDAEISYGWLIIGDITYWGSTESTTDYFIGNYKIQGKDEEGIWVDLYSGANNSNSISVYMDDNDGYYTYYRILILNNDSLLSRFEADYYAISQLVFYTYAYSSLPGTGYDVLYSFDDDVTSRELHVVNATRITGDSTNNIYDTDTAIEGSISVAHTLDQEDESVYSYVTTADEVGISEDYSVAAIGNSVSATISGTTGEDGAVGTIYISEDSTVLNGGFMDVVGETKIEDGYIYSNLSGQQMDINNSNNDYIITTDLIYTVTLSGTIPDGYLGDVAVTGNVNRYEDTTTVEKTLLCNIDITNVVGTGTITEGSSLCLWDQPPLLAGLEFSTHDSIVFDITEGEAYDCRLTAWDDVTHSTTINHLIAQDYVRVSALAFRAEGTILEPEVSLTYGNYIASPIYNRIFKGDTVYNGTNYYYGDFSLSHRTEPGMIGDYLIFKPMLYGVNDTIPYGIHDHVIVLHYTYT